MLVKRPFFFARRGKKIFTYSCALIHGGNRVPFPLRQSSRDETHVDDPKLSSSLRTHHFQESNHHHPSTSSLSTLETRHLLLEAIHNFECDVTAAQHLEQVIRTVAHDSRGVGSLLEGRTFQGFNWSGLTWYLSLTRSLLDGCSFEASRLCGPFCVASQAALRSVNVCSVSAHRLDFLRSEFYRVDFRNSQWKKCSFHACQFVECDFRGAQFFECHWGGPIVEDDVHSSVHTTAHANPDLDPRRMGRSVPKLSSSAHRSFQPYATFTQCRFDATTFLVMESSTPNGAMQTLARQVMHAARENQGRPTIRKLGDS